MLALLPRRAHVARAVPQSPFPRSPGVPMPTERLTPRAVTVRVDGKPQGRRVQATISFPSTSSMA